MLKPHLTEKAIEKNSAGVYVFDVDTSANKHTVKSLIESVFGVKVARVNILIKRGKIKRFRGGVGQRNTLKKAMVTLQSGQKIAGFEQEADKKETKPQSTDTKTTVRKAASKAKAVSSESK